MATNPAQSRARRYLDGLLPKLKKEGMGRLPRLKDLCRAARVSPAVMERALESYRRRGDVYSRQGAGIFLRLPDSGCKPDRAAGHPPVPSPPAWRKTRDRLVADLINGHLPPGARLPGFKALCEQYGVSYRPLKAALDTLVTDGQLEYHRRHYRVPSLVTSGSSRMVVLIARGQRDGTVSLVSPWTGEMLHALQQQCSRANAVLKITQGYFETLERMYHPDLHDIMRSPARLEKVFGFVYITDAMELFPIERMLLDLCALGKPVAIIDDNGYCDSFLHKLPPHLAKAYTVTGGQRAGYDVGRHLIARGHRSVAFFSHSPASQWSRCRLEGLVRAFDRYNIGDSVHAFGCDTRIDPPEAGIVSELSNKCVYMLQDAINYSFDHSTMHSALWQLHMNIVQFLRRHVQAEKMATILEEALSNRDMTAWVAVNDTVAVICMDFLAARTVAVPERISIIGFDNSPEATFRNLTSYSYNVPALAHRIAMDLIYPPIKPQRAPCRQPIETDGMIVQRGTTKDR